MNALVVRVNDGLVLDAGRWEDLGGQIVVHPPQQTLFDQLLDYLDAQVTIGSAPARLSLDEEAVAVVSLCIRWGSYFAILVDVDKPLWPAIRHAPEDVSRIADPEMARINVESSAALARLIDLKIESPDRYDRVVAAAHRYLPLSRRRARVSDSAYGLLTALANVSLWRLTMDGGQTMSQACQEYATRVLANAMVNTCWRNTEAVEGLHAGYCASYPLDHCRLTRVEEHRLVDEVCGAFVYGLKTIHMLAAEESDRTWPQRVQPFGSVPFVAPAGWSLDEVTRLVVFQKVGG